MDLQIAAHAESAWSNFPFRWASNPELLRAGGGWYKGVSDLEEATALEAVTHDKDSPPGGDAKTAECPALPVGHASRIVLGLGFVHVCPTGNLTVQGFAIILQEDPDR